MNAEVGGQREARRSAGVFVRSTAGLHRFYGPASLFLALSVAGFAIMHRGRICSGIFSYFPDSSPRAMF